MQVRALILFIWFSFFLLYCTSLSASSLKINRALIFSYLVSNPSQKVVKNAYFYTYVPIDTPWQKVIRLEHTCPQGTFLKDILGNTILKCLLPLMPPYSKIQIDVRAWLILKDRPEGKILLKNKERFLGPQKYIECNVPKIKTLALRLRSNSPYLTSRRIFNWVKNNLRFKNYIARPLGALNALEKKIGDCTEGMSLFVALERANGIPSAGVSGYLVNNNGKVAPSSYHNWALFYTNAVFKIADPKEGNFDTKYERYVATTIIGKRSESEHIPLGLFDRFKVSTKILKVKQI